MNQSTFETKFRASLDRLRSRRQSGGLENFEREVWAEIAVRERPQPAGIFGWLWDMLRLRSPVAAPVCALMMAVTSGALLALNRADAYEAREAAALERRYVASIHPVMRSETFDANSDREP